MRSVPTNKKPIKKSAMTLEYREREDPLVEVKLKHRLDATSTSVGVEEAFMF